MPITARAAAAALYMLTAAEAHGNPLPVRPAAYPAATLRGQAVLSVSGGEVTCASRGVMLTGQPGLPPLMARCDTAGHFVFANLQPGPSTLQADLTWLAPAKQGMRSFGRIMQRRINLHSGDNKILLGSAVNSP